jgi:nucleoside-diphosphate-sugar epimerase
MASLARSYARMTDSPPSLRGQLWTIVGARGWIGAHLTAYLRAHGATVAEVPHAEPARGAVGNVVWCSGVTYGAEQSARDAFRAHVVAVERWLDADGIASFTYLSSTRVYDHVVRTTEDTPLLLRSDAIYALTKGAGETLVLSSAPGGRVVRMSNVYGTRPSSPLFLNDVLRQAALHRRIKLQTSLDSAKDYVGLSETIAVIPRIALHGRERVYNVAAGYNTTSREIVDGLRALDPRIVVDVPDPAPRAVTPEISVARIRAEFGFHSRPLTAALPELYRDAVAQFSGASARLAGSATPGRGDGAASG